MGAMNVDHGKGTPRANAPRSPVGRAGAHARQPGGQRSRESLIRLLDNLHEGACLTDSASHVTYWSASAEQLTGYGSTQVLGRPCVHKLLHLESEAGTPLCAGICPVAETFKDGRARELAVRFRRQDGERVLSHMRIVPIVDDRGRVAGAVELFNDRAVHETVRVRIAEVQKALSIDPVTELANRRYADLQLEARLHELTRFGWSFGLLFFDIDHFKGFNDMHGHAVGDRVLAKVARTAAACVRGSDTLCRWGGDEFIALIGHVNAEQLTQVAEKLRALVAQSAVRVAQRELPVTLSIGAALADRAEAAVELLARADHLMYLSKAMGGNRVTFGSVSDPRPSLQRAFPAGDERGMRVLLVDDHEVVRQGLSALLEGAPDVHIIGQATNGAEAVEMVGRLLPDVVVMDVTMPVMDGVEATRQISRLYPGVRVVGLSALPDSEPAQRMTEAGASVFVSKAASARELLRAIRGSTPTA